MIAWATSVIEAYPGLPTIISTHDYLSPTAERLSGGFLDFTLVDPENHNTPEQLFQKLIVPNDQIFLVLCGHYHGQAFRIDENAATPMGVTAASAPPAIAASISPRWIQRNASPIACAPDAHALVCV